MVQFLERRPSFGERLGAGIGSGAGKGITKAMDFAQELYVQKQKDQESKKRQSELVEELINHGVPEEQAQLYAKFTTGGQTAFAKDILESAKRGTPSFGQRITKPFDKLEGIQEAAQESSANQVSDENIDQELEDLSIDTDQGLTPSERVKRASERYKTNWPIYQEAGTKLRGMTRDKERINILESLDKSGKLPQNLGRLNVDDEGNLRFPFASSPEAQRYVKTLNEFSAGAKDTFGSRVTNFDLQQYLLRYPNLLNSEKGRKQIYQQMKIVNDINSIYYKNLKSVYDKAGGVRNIDPDIAEQMADRLTEPKIKDLQKKFEEIGSFPTLPNPAEAKGRRVRNKETGEILESDGENWNPVQ